MFIFFHIPKTAGSSFSQKLVTELKAENIVDIVSPPSLAYISDRHLNNADLVRGHFGVAIQNRISRNFKSCSIFRSPVMRVVSQYKWICLLFRNGELGERGGGGVFFEYIDPDLNPSKNCLNLKRIFTDIKRKPTLAGAFKDLQIWTFFSDPMLFMRHTISNEDEFLELACKNVLQLDAFGISEEMDKTYSIFNHCFGFNMVNDSFLKTTGDIELAVDSELIELIEFNNQLDMKFYSWVRAEFFERFSKLKNKN